MPEHKSHDLTETIGETGVRFEKKPVKDLGGKTAAGLYSAWITLDNPGQFNSYTTAMIKEVILNFRRASNCRDVVAVVFTGSGDRAFCSGGNTKEYAEYYAGDPEEYRQYMRLFNDMVTSILRCDKPVICRVNGMRIAGGQEIGMACDFSVASDLARFGQAGPRHGSVADGGSTDFLPLYVGVEQAMYSCTLCEPWSAYKAERLGLIIQAVPVLEVDGRFIPNPTVITDRWVENGRIVYGEFKTGEEAAAGKEILKSGQVDLSPLDEAVERICAQVLETFPGCMIKTVESVRKHKLAHWDKNHETNRAWLALNMMTEGKAGFTAFNQGSKEVGREVNFARLRRLLAEGERWSDALIEKVMPWSK
ncbi:MAG: 6-oxocyclohex-1-ene-1-carbonyl-CoA hydratase [Deltaproteobacteria bacterium]|nr:6-oxocyclohex-1-ene-1-carbonyl-CoA hydratase [Deltaproteobacteria bacterium]